MNSIQNQVIADFNSNNNNGQKGNSRYTKKKVKQNKDATF